MRIFILALCAAALLLPAALFAEGQREDGPPASLSRGQRDLGVVVLEDFAVKDGRLSFTAASGGCTTKADFKVTVRQGKAGPNETLYILTIERTRADDCKALLPEGVTIEFDLAKDLGLKGDYAFTVTNPMGSAVKRPR
jgi:hypothetical protein